LSRCGRPSPNHVRVTIGLRDEMAKFKTAFEKAMG
jgi:histidinol-phosphate/aromatic aminotransferase/cobyric acid decarboxylase-like protein